jgi:hypothetical protein
VFLIADSTFHFVLAWQPAVAQVASTCLKLSQVLTYICVVNIMWRSSVNLPRETSGGLRSLAD